MRLSILADDKWQVVAVLDARGRCRIRETLDEIQLQNRIGYDSVLAVLRHTARAGPPNDPRRSRRLAPDIFELKTAEGFRLLYFFQPGRIVVCSELLRKPKPRELRMVVQRAQRLRAQFVAARAKGRLVIEREG